ncbi:ATP-dependent Clp protease proteolytic subunit [Bradyrhizobium sp. WYCCWR 13022]|uniref:ATP-dependent Clp protease proteolytic subunit n=1 Tax=unclassified Bradyrhizobium TaxID=2631580 RepID=UPI00263A5D0D|nr:ATP-dependent Clp protease proteolytic subunit [Bradyrhizobium sp. WYCCWR 13022]MDN4986573.1 ATP-dependent Clp protease proteolytic subunit [Bradyrhizobium sp. WYCCWR 13022]
MKNRILRVGSIALTIVLSSAIPSKLLGATFKSVAAKDGKTIIFLTGEIIEGDADTLKAAIKSANDAGKLVSGVRLNSPGGNLLEGLKLADAVRFAKVATNVAANATCASACFLVYAAGSTKFANYNAQVGVHGASDKQGEETVASGAATVSMARAAKDLGVPAAIIGRMVVTPPSEMVWLTPQDLQSMGTTMVGKPSQTPISPTATADSSIMPKQTQPGEPTQLQPQTKSAAQTSWAEFLDKVIKRSADQNNGKPYYTRGCQPEFKTCYDAVSVVASDGKLSMVKVTKDMKDKIIRREICSFNDSADIRTCYDWDEGTAHRDMKDSSGNWYKIADE